MKKTTGKDTETPEMEPGKVKQKQKTENDPEPGDVKNGGQDDDQDFEQSTGYIRDPETGEWKIHNPAGSFGYNYLYRDY